MRNGGNVECAVTAENRMMCLRTGRLVHPVTLPNQWPITNAMPTAKTKISSVYGSNCAMISEIG